MSANSCLQFNGYSVNTIEFKLTNDFPENIELQIDPEFSVDLQKNKKEKGNYKVSLSFLLESTIEKPLPFRIKVQMTGDFSLCEETNTEISQEILIRENTIAIMFPFLRSIIASLTTTANIPTLILPIINITNAFKDDIL